MTTHTSVGTDRFTFQVDDVELGTDCFRPIKIHKRLERVLGRKIESCYDYHSEVSSKLEYHPLLAAVYTAYCLHLPLTLSPDALWLTITQGVAQHMAIHGERLRSRFVKHTGRVVLTVETSGWVRQSPENPWEEAIEGWTDQIRNHVGSELHDNLLCNYSTSDKASQIASRIVMMDIFETYFKYVLYCICGIPSVTLRGTEADWRTLAEKVRALRCFDMDWWLDPLEPIVDAIADTRSGNVNLEHWKNICKRTDAYGGDIINGWIAYFFPYLRESGQGPCKLRNPIFETGEGFNTMSAPTGLSQVPFVWKEMNGKEYLMNAVGGLIGVRQDPQTLALEPIPGWAICEAEKTDSLVHQIRSQSNATGIQAMRIQDSVEDLLLDSDNDLEQVLAELGACTIVQKGSQEPVELISPQKSNFVDWGEELVGYDLHRPHGRTWLRLAKLANNQFLAINLDHDRPTVDCLKSRRHSHESTAPICVYSESTRGKQGANPVVALNFAELANGLINKQVMEGYFWTQADFQPYCDANEITRITRLLR